MVEIYFQAVSLTIVGIKIFIVFTVFEFYKHEFDFSMLYNEIISIKKEEEIKN